MPQHHLESIAFPTLDETQIAQLARCTTATPKVCRDGQILFAVGERNAKFFIVKSGEVEILDQSGEAPKTVTVHRAGGFTGDVSHLTGNPAVVTAVARGNCEVYEVSGNALRQVLNQCPTISDILLQAFIARRQLLQQSADFVGLRVIGSRYSTDTFRVRDFLAKNRILFTWVDLETDPSVDRLLKEFGVSEGDTPVIAFAQMVLLRNPSNEALADAIGIRHPVDETIYDLVIVGAGPAGLAAAVYGASEGLRTLVLERVAPGGQAGSSMRIENYLGFPTGLTGSELTDRATLQAHKFGARLSIPTSVIRLMRAQAYSTIHLDNGQSLTSKCMILATGADYRRLGVEGCEKFEGKGVYYAATPQEAKMCQGTDVVVVGGGNSAGQGAVFLAQHACRVWLIIRGEDLYAHMSSYLIRRIEQTANIVLHPETMIGMMHGRGHLEAVELVNLKTGQTNMVETPAIFSFIGAVPRTDWLPADIERDADGFIKTGPTVAQSPRWNLARQPFLLETSSPGIFAAGDVRSGSSKRVASAVGEGAMAVQFVHQYLKVM